MRWIAAIVVLGSGCTRGPTAEGPPPRSAEPPRAAAQIPPQPSPSEVLELIGAAQLGAPVLPPPPGKRQYEHDRYVVVVGGRDGGTRHDGEVVIEGTDLPERPIVAAWRIAADGGETPVSATPWAVFDEIPFDLRVRTLWAGVESSPQGEMIINAAVLIPGGSSGASVHIARADGGWKLVSVEHEWVE